MRKPSRKPRKHYGPFVLAAIAYSTGVIAFSFWGYFQQRTHFLEADTRLLTNATHATEQILGNVFIACAVQTETPYEIGYAANQANLNRFATDGHFDLLGAIGHKGTKAWTLIAGGEQTNTHTASVSDLHDLLRTHLTATVQALADSGTNGIQIKTMEVGEYKQLRIAIRYQALGVDTGYATFAAHNIRHVLPLRSALILRAVTIGLFLHIMAIPLIVLFNRAQAKTAQATEALNAQLQQDAIKQKAREAELEDAIHDLERFNAVATGRENRIIQLKCEVNTLLAQEDRKNRYAVDAEE